jgi:CRP/FNR family transcriptional regulator
LHCILNRELIFDATARVTHMLSNNLERFNKFKRHEVSTMLNIQPETLSRILTKLKQKNIIEFDKTDIIIIDEGQLQNTFTGNNGLKYAE